MTKILTTHNAEITTASVQVKTLTVSGKQVTQGVFRQLREEPLISEDGTLNGVPWGYVNYHLDKCEKDRAHLHIVWQLGADLLRCRVDLTPAFDRETSRDYIFATESGHTFYNECVRLELQGEAPRYFSGKPIRRIKRSGWLSDWVPSAESETTFNGLPVLFLMIEEVHEAAKAFARVDYAKREHAEVPSDYRSRELVEREQDLAKKLAAIDDTYLGQVALVDELFRTYQAEADAEIARRQRHRDTIAAIQALPHLFIAV